MRNIGIDVGGTFIKAAIVEHSGKVVLSSKTPTPKSGYEIAVKVGDMIEELLLKAHMEIGEIQNIGIGVPGVCDSKRGVIVSCPNIQNCEDIAICEYIKKRFDIRAFLDNDANCAALGEYIVSDEKPDSFVFVTLGTGVGGGIIINGRLLRGVNSAAGEIGHMVIKKGGEKCNCGRYGCWERYASVSALSRQGRAANLKGHVSGRSIFADMAKGSIKAKEVIDAWLLNVAEGICDLVNIFQPDEIVIGGGISREGDIILNPVKKFVAENAIIDKRGGKNTVIKISRLFNDAGVVGASFLYTQN